MKSKVNAKERKPREAMREGGDERWVCSVPQIDTSLSSAARPNHMPQGQRVERRWRGSEMRCQVQEGPERPSILRGGSLEKKERERVTCRRVRASKVGATKEKKAN